MKSPLPWLRNSIRRPTRRSTWVRQRRPASWMSVWIWLGVLVVATLLLLHPLNQHLPAALLKSARWLGRDAQVTLYFLLAGIAYLVYYLPRRSENRPFSLSAGAVGALFASILGLGTYIPCLPTGTPWWSSVYHTMALFVGSVHEPFGATGSSCPYMPVSLEVARILALGVALGALVAVLMRLFVEQVDRLRVRFAHRVVLVTGLSEDTEDFILRLKAMYDGGSRVDEFEDPQERKQAERWLKDEYRQVAHIVVVEPNRAHPSVARLRQAGVRVVTADPITFADLGRPRLDQCLSAAYLLATDSTSNERGADALLSLLIARPARQDLVPVRIMVRIDDARDAEEYRRRAMSSPTRAAVVDTFGPQQVTCQRIADLAEERNPAVIVLAGTGPLATTMLDELAHSARERVASGVPAPTTPAVVVGPGATSLVADHIFRQRWYDNTPVDVRAVEGPANETEIVAAIEAAGRGGHAHGGGHRGDPSMMQPFVIDCRRGDQGALLAYRCVQRWPLSTALHHDPAANGVEPASGVQGLHRFASSLLRDGNLPEGRWMRAARIMHERYRKRYGHQEDSAGAQPWEVLSDFYRMSNLRALTHAMHLVGALDNVRVWRPVAETQRPEALTVGEYTEVGSRLEHEDWRAYYERGGWEHGPERDEAGRKHPLLVPWDDSTSETNAKIKEKSEASLRGAFALLEALGYRPYQAENPAGQHSGT